MRRLQTMIMRGVVRLVNSALEMQVVQGQGLGGLTLEGVEHFEAYGFTSKPHAGAECIYLSVGGRVGSSVVICVADRRFRLSGLVEGEVALFDDLGQKIVLHRDRIEVTAPKVVVMSDDVSLGGTGGAAVARVGDDVDLGTGKIISGSSKVTAL